MTKILLTGGTGFVGKHLIERLGKKNFEIIAITRKDTPSASRKLHYIKADLTSYSSVQRIKKEISNCKVYILLSALIPDSKKEHSEFETIDNNLSYNFVAHVNLLKNICKDVEKIVFVSSIDVYGHYKNTWHKEEDVCFPDTYYGAMKLATENLLRIYCKNNHIKLLVLRPSQVYGPGDLPIKVIPKFTLNILNNREIKLYGGGIARRRYLYVEDLIGAINLAVQKDVEGVFNIAGKEIISIRKVIEIIEGAAGKKARVKILNNNTHVLDCILDTNKAETTLGFRPKVSLEKGISLTVRHLISQLK